MATKKPARLLKRLRDVRDVGGVPPALGELGHGGAGPVVEVGDPRRGEGGGAHQG